ncbi:MAG: cell division protein FtsI (penicillin-binding protein 3) [Hyphomicrobiaceae bacterium]|jgi:cell division protein FtsI (penicillin-binding protein 3)
MTVSPRKTADSTARPQPADARTARVAAVDRAGLRERALRVALVFGAVGFGFTGVGAQLIHLGLQEQATAPRASISRPLSETYSRPDIVDRNGHILATDVVMQSLYADPSKLLGASETLEALGRVIPGINTAALARVLSNRKRRFAWIKRGISPATAQQIHELGLPGIEFKPEPKRSYPQGRVAGHVIGHVNIDNKGTAAIERYVDASVGVRQVVGDPQGDKRQLKLTVDLRAQVALESELASAMDRFQSVAASGVILDVESGAVRAAASLPSVDPANPIEAQHLRYLDRLKRGTYELGSIFKAVTIAMALEKRTVTTKTVFDVRNPIEIGQRFRIVDEHGPRRPLTVEEIFIYSSNVGAGMMALEVGERYQRKFLRKLGLLDRMQTDAGQTAEPQLPPSWGKAEVVTIAYGHGLAIAPLQFAAAGAALVNGGFAVQPVFVEKSAGSSARKRVLSAKTSVAIRRLMRRNVTSPKGSGRRAAVPGYDVGGKTGTADRAAAGRYDGNSVVTSFFAAFPMVKPRYVVLVTLHDPKGSGARNQRFASLNAAPTTGRIIERVAPLLGVLPK